MIENLAIIPARGGSKRIPKKNIVVGRKNLDITNQIIKLLNDNITKLK